MSRRLASGPARRDGFSLIEMILATAILAASGSALFMLIGQASRFGLRAEEESTALQLAQSLLDETIAMPAAVETEGTFENDPRWSYRIVRETVEGGSSAGGGISTGAAASMGVPGTPRGGTAAGGGTATGGGTAGGEPAGGTLTRIVVEVMRSDEAPRPVAPSGSSGASDLPVCRLARWVVLVEPAAETRSEFSSAAAP